MYRKRNGQACKCWEHVDSFDEMWDHDSGFNAVLVESYTKDAAPLTESLRLFVF